jgi:hypothetical protein
MKSLARDESSGYRLYDLPRQLNVLVACKARVDGDRKFPELQRSCVRQLPKRVAVCTKMQSGKVDASRNEANLVIANLGGDVEDFDIDASRR